MPVLNTKEAASGPEAGRESPPEDGKKDVPPRNSGMAEKETLSENWDTEKLWTAQGVGRRRNEDDPPCKSGMAQGKLRRGHPHEEQGGTRNLEITVAPKKTAGDSTR
jgi:hypothetical protein